MGVFGAGHPLAQNLEGASEPKRCHGGGTPPRGAARDNSDGEQLSEGRNRGRGRRTGCGVQTMTMASSTHELEETWLIHSSKSQARRCSGDSLPCFLCVPRSSSSVWRLRWRPTPRTRWVSWRPPGSPPPRSSAGKRRLSWEPMPSRFRLSTRQPTQSLEHKMNSQVVHGRPHLSSAQCHHVQLQPATDIRHQLQRQGSAARQPARRQLGPQRVWRRAPFSGALRPGSGL